ncbi:FGGY-family carbohydrate kinase [Trichothermofontia sichuanensis B231]|uniref:FGGY-family carbohydrate kinase n=1 Tax=Trichothermofontia sichuanensis TaxID=3045816 RepID=UPI002245F067|nr:FGGY-family carbohydrate kinase [Trichothermofontia sichuanensis]UZQ53261.1 FGGY-family carbohydrate kinase [Trichothermofontia sichuanensis B231]
MRVHPPAAGRSDPTASIDTPRYGLGIDFGTSGARAMVVETDARLGHTAATLTRAVSLIPCLHPRIVCNQQVSLPTAWPDLTLPSPPGWRWAPWSVCQYWQVALLRLLAAIPVALRQRLATIAINGTSSTVLLCDATGQPVTEPLLYNDDRAVTVIEQVQAIAPPDHVVISATSSFSKVLWWQAQGIPATLPSPLFLLHQADWLAFLLHGRLGISDTHNVLKLGYDVVNDRYPEWVLRATASLQLPQVVAPGTAIGPVCPAVAEHFQIASDCQICAGTTDSVAAFLASGAAIPGEAVTSLGSTLVLKLLSETRIEVAQYGIYSHRLGDRWLVGGASNTGGAVLKHFFTEAELVALSAQIDPNQASPLHYYPLLRSGERFPINDPSLAPQLEPRPASAIAFLHGLLESMARIEAQGYALLTAYGAPPLQRVYTAGGGAHNPAWTAIRQRCLGVPVLPATQTEAAYGTALLGLGLI